MREFDPSKESVTDSWPVYTDENIRISQATDSAVPGLYTIKPVSNKESVVDLNDTELAEFAYMQWKIRAELRSVFNIVLSGLYFEEHPGYPVTSYSIPFHIDRLSERFSVEVYQPHIEDYLKSYSASDSKKQRDAFDTAMRDALSSQKAHQDIENIENGMVRLSKTNEHHRREAQKPHEIEQILEVCDESELPEAPEGKKYFVCIGGSKNFQCFLGNSNISRGEFILSHEDEMDDCLKPIYIDDDIIVRQDVKYAIPGFYIISPRQHFRSIDEMPQDLFLKCMFMAREIKKGLLTLGITQSHAYNDEKYNSPAFAHFWVLPIYQSFVSDNNLNPTIYSKDIWKYLDLFPRFMETKQRILEFNKIMKNHLSTNYPSMLKHARR